MFLYVIQALILIMNLGEVEELRSESDELPSRTRGKKIDAYKQERDLDNALKQEGAYDDDDF